MKRTIAPLMILLMFLVPTFGNASYLIRLRNGGQVSTSGYWNEGKWIVFVYAGGTAGIEKREIERIERYRTAGAVETKTGRKVAPPSPPRMEIPQEPGEIPKESQAKEVEQKVNIEEYRKKKDEMTAEVDKLLEKQREATARGDDEAKKRIQEEYIHKTKEIYRLTDEVKEKNKGKLPDGWWETK